MGYFKTYKNQNKITKKQKVQDLMKAERIQKLVSSNLCESSSWSKRYEYHTKKWNYYDKEEKNEYKFVYHLGLANLAKKKVHKLF